MSAYPTYPLSGARGPVVPNGNVTAPTGDVSPAPSNATTVTGQATNVSQGVNNTATQSLTNQTTTSSTQISSTIQTAITAEVRTAMTHVLSNVPWIKFRVHAEPDLQVFQTDVQLQQALTQISQVAASSIAQTIITEFTTQMQTLIQSITKTASTQISTTMIQLIQELITVSTLTHFSTNASPLIIPGIPECPADIVDIIPVKPIGPTDPIGPLTPIGPKIPIEPETPIVPIGPDTAQPLNPVPDIATSSWIWTREVQAGMPPGGSRPFRKFFYAPIPVDRLTIDITCDNFYTLYVNGLLVGSGNDWTKSQRYKVAFAETQTVVVAVYGVNDAVSLREAGLLASAVTWRMASPEDGSFSFGTDSSWKTLPSPNFSPGFTQVNFNDYSWDNATVEGPYGMPPWGNVAKPVTYTAQNAGLTQLPGGTADAPTAPAAEVLTQ